MDCSRTLAALWLCLCCWLAPGADAAPIVLGTGALRVYTDRFAEEDRWYFNVTTDAAVSQVNNGVYGGQYIKNGQAFAWLQDNIPLIDVPDTALARTYYFRWWTYRKHIKNIGTTQAPSFVITEFIDPVPWSDGAANSIAAPLGHHIYEGRWLNDKKIIKDYESYWLANPNANPRRYSAWLADAVLASLMIHGDSAHAVELVAGTVYRLNLAKNWSGWLQASNAPGGAAQSSYHNDAVHLFWQSTDRDAMENSLTGDGYKPSINSYLYGDAKATAQLFRVAAKIDPANAAGHLRNAAKFDSGAKALKKAVQELSWDPGKAFFMNGYFANGTFTRASKREEVGFTPWFFGLPDDGGTVDYNQAWQNTVMAAGVFKAPYGLTSGARNEAGFNPGAEGECCRWDGPIWPFATSITLKAFANLLHAYHQAFVTKADYFHTLSTFAASHRNKLVRGGQTRTISWIDESMTADDGGWVHILFDGDVLKPRGFSYNHSTFNDLIISDLIGLRPRLDDTVEVDPLAPDDWKYFALDNVAYHGKTLTVLWDRDGTKYGLGQGLSVFINGKLAARSAEMKRLRFNLNSPPTAIVATRTAAFEIKITRVDRRLLIGTTGPESFRAELVGVAGRVVRAGNVLGGATIFLSTQGLGPGIYGLRVITSAGTACKKVALLTD